jgi:hypothetical protein
MQIFNSTNVRLSLFGLAALGGVSLAGCGGGGIDRVPVYKVETQVLFEGQPLPGAFVVLHPKANVDPKAISARGYVDAQGKLVPTTYEEGDGVAPGEFAVTVEYRPLVQTVDGVSAGANVLPERYSNPQTTDLIIRVAEGKNEVPPLNLTR